MISGIKNKGHTAAWQLALGLTMFSLILPTAVACGSNIPPPAKEGEMTLSLSSTAFKEGERLPISYTCDGQDISPPLEWSEPPMGTRAFALIVDDPDAPGGVFTHWVIFNLPPDSRKLAEAMPAQAQLSSGALQGKNDFGRIGYNGPCPPAGRPHHYQFNLYALDQTLSLKAGIPRKELVSAMQGHILAQHRLTGIYQR
jgi:Raf kinase inhibitor-like YbhB/YbcL family protein